MCGISGSYQFQLLSDELLSEDETHTSLLKMRHRGPDFFDLKNFNTCILGHSRLKILDLSSKANQPMSDVTGRFTIVFNGEIFNYQDLRSSLEKKGVEFLTTSDTEVLLHLLIRDNTSALNQLNGFFAFAFYDKVKDELIIARDRFGEKPLWYFKDDKKINFASELKGLLAYKIPREIDIVSLSLYLQLTYIPAPHSIYKNIFKLQPGHLLRCHSGKVEEITWYNPDHSSTVEKRPENLQFQLQAMMQDAVDIRMHADVKIGCFLSGGVDSSIVSLLAAKNHPGLPTFSIAFSNQPFLDETTYAKEVANHISSHHEVISISTSNFFEEISSIWNQFDEPFADSSSLAVSLLCSVVKQKVTVALSGDGADEIFGGYNKHLALQKSMRNSTLNKVIPTLLPFIDLLPVSRNSKVYNRFRQLNKYAQGLELPLKERYMYWTSWSDESLCELLVTQEIAVRKGARINSFVQDIDPNDCNTLLLADQKLVLANDMLTKVDMMSMLHALEVRAPFLDYRIVEFANSLDPSFKCDGLRRKIILADTFRDQLPESVFTRPKKGFEVPLEHWLQHELKELVFDMLGGDNLKSFQYLKKESIQGVLDSFYKKGKSELAYLVYALLVFEHWYRHSHEG